MTLVGSCRLAGPGDALLLGGGHGWIHDVPTPPQPLPGFGTRETFPFWDKAPGLPLLGDRWLAAMLGQRGRQASIRQLLLPGVGAAVPPHTRAARSLAPSSTWSMATPRRVSTAQLSQG